MFDETLSRTDGAETPTATGAAPVPPAGYELLDEVGRGGMGVVYRARDVSLNREVAVKVLAERYAAGSAAAVRFLDEAQITGQLQHPGIPAVYRVGELPDGRPFLAMKLIRGYTLTDVLGGQPAANLDAHLGYFEKVCLAIGYSHAKGVVHRDLTPSNVLISDRGRVQVIDWGLSKVLAAPQSRDPDADPRDHGGTTQMVVTNLSHTAEGIAIGTPAYMSPEQASGTLPATEQSDVFGLGGILFHLLTGQPPHQGKVSTILKRVRAGDLDNVYARLDRSGGPKAVVALAKACLSPDPADRPKNAAALARAVAECRVTLNAPRRRGLWAKLFGAKG